MKNVKQYVCVCVMSKESEWRTRQLKCGIALEEIPWGDVLIKRPIDLEDSFSWCLCLCAFVLYVFVFCDQPMVFVRSSVLKATMCNMFNLILN